jgi:hypothetical protein
MGGAVDVILALLDRWGAEKDEGGESCSQMDQQMGGMYGGMDRGMNGENDGGMDRGMNGENDGGMDR